ncbi:hypothetical protein [Pelagerythrobacter rhizovicinus]|uniref:Uncharacterized protein n=1 Tax=Pelagerythrobacter rhizovicinus TaxID=2268576 RepID=A0A4Q2KGN9_9SPHN|nr:hypothetical protein [Pelagerythrobacter rhizovicinus]RXZ64235.1 hypothetical protein ETX26_10000 [Pelagerythrobacter rhizovicinus]
MSTTEQNDLAMAKDPEIVGRIVRNITQLERDFRLADGYLSDWLIRMITISMKVAAPEPFTIESTAWSAYLSHPDWKPTKRIGRGDAWLEIVERARDDQDHTWIAAALGAGPTELSLELTFREGLSHYFMKLEGDEGLIAKLRKKGFKIDPGGKRVYLPIVINADLLAKALPTDDFEDAMAPVREAVELSIAAKPEIDLLLNLVRR